MSDTGMFAGSGTQGATAENACAGNRYAVRVKQGKYVVTIRVNTEQLGRQQKIADANASIRRRSRS